MCHSVMSYLCSSTTAWCCETAETKTNWSVCWITCDGVFTHKKAYYTEHTASISFTTSTSENKVNFPRVILRGFRLELFTQTTWTHQTSDWINIIRSPTQEKKQKKHTAAILETRTSDTKTAFWAEWRRGSSWVAPFYRDVRFLSNEPLTLLFW